MSNVAPIKIDTTDGRLPIKDKGLVFQEFANKYATKLKSSLPRPSSLNKLSSNETARMFSKRFDESE